MCLNQKQMIPPFLNIIGNTNSVKHAMVACHERVNFIRVYIGDV